MGGDGTVEALLREDHVGILAVICGGGRWSSRTLAHHVLFAASGYSGSLGRSDMGPYSRGWKMERKRRQIQQERFYQQTNLIWR